MLRLAFAPQRGPYLTTSVRSRISCNKNLSNAVSKSRSFTVKLRLHPQMVFAWQRPVHFGLPSVWC